MPGSDSGPSRASSDTVNKDNNEEMLRRQALWKDNQNALSELSRTSKGDAGSRNGALSNAKVPEDPSWTAGKQ